MFCGPLPSPAFSSSTLSFSLSQPQRLGRALHAVPLWLIQLAVRASWGPIQSLGCSLEYCTIRHSVPVPQGVRPLWSSPGGESHIPGAGPGPTPRLPALQSGRPGLGRNSKGKRALKGREEGSLSFPATGALRTWRLSTRVLPASWTRQLHLVPDWQFYPRTSA